MASLAQLKVAMYVPLVLVSVIFAAFLVAVMWVLQLGYVWAFVITGIFILGFFFTSPISVQSAEPL